jgi:hypothetical protein
MSVYRVVGQRLIAEKHLAPRASEVRELLARKVASLTFPSGTFKAEDFVPTALAAVAPAGGIPQWKPVGTGLPLTVEIRHLYTGRYPHTILNSANMLVTSSVKNLNAFDASAEAVNFLMPKQSSRKDYVAPPADKNGTPIVCYVPAVTALKTTITFNLIFQRFSDDILTEIESIFTSAASIPLFLSAAPYLVGANAVLKLAGDIGDAIFNGTPDYSPTMVLNFGDPGESLTAAGFTVLFKDDEDPGTNPEKLTFDTKKGLVDPNTTQAYTGPAPYIVISIDGTIQDSLKDFTPTAASASLMAKFFNVKDSSTIPSGDIIDALKALSDIKFRRAADELQKKIENTPDGPEKDALKQQLDAVVKNIQNDILKPH